MLLSFACSLKAQPAKGTVTVNARQDLLSVLPAEAAYFLTRFEEAVIYFTDGTTSSGTVNICLVDNSIRFIAPAGDTLLMSRGDRVLRILVSDTLILKANDYFARQIAVFGPYSLSERKSLELDVLQEKKTGAYGSVHPTSTAMSANLMLLDPSRKFEAATDISYSMKSEYVLTDETDVYKARAAAFCRLFPEKKREIKKFIKEQSLDMESGTDLLRLFLFCADNDKQ